MQVTVKTPPSPFVTVSDARMHLRVDHSDDNAYITSLVAAATAWLDGPSGWLGRALGRQTLELATERWDDCGDDGLPLPYPPIFDLQSVIYVDPSGNSVTAADGAFQIVQGRLLPAWGTSWPALACRPDAVRVTYRAGYDTDAVPPPIRVAILMLVGQWYQNREPVVLGATVEALPFAVEALLSPFRVYR